MPVAKPTILAYGNSFATAEGNKLHTAKPHGLIEPSALNANTFAETIELNEFEEQIKDAILARLGFPTVRVELTPFQLKVCMDEAISTLSYHAPSWMTQFATFAASAGINLYEIPRYILDNLTYVVYKKSLLSIQSQANTLEFDFFIKYFQDNFLFQDFDVGSFYLLQSHLEQIRKVLGQEGSWDIIDNKYLQLYPAPYVNDQVILEFRAINTDTIHPFYKLFIQKYATACAKIMLGEIRGKYSSLPSPGGGVALNGDRMILQGEAEKEKLTEDLIWRIDEPPVFTLF